MIRVQLQPAFVLHRRAYRDTSLLLDIFTRDYGRLGVVAKGARQRNNADKGLLQPFNPVLIGCSGRGELLTLTGVERGAGHGILKAHALFAGLYMNELLSRLLHRGDPHEMLFDAYADSLENLAAVGSHSLEPILRQFELQLLLELGYGLSLTHEIISGNALSPAQTYYYDIERGPVAANHAPAEAQPRVSGRCLLALAAGEFGDAELWPEMKLLMRFVLTHHMNGRPVKSRELYS